MDLEKGLRVHRSLVIPYDELEISVSTSGGPGGQHANRTKSRVEIRFNVAESPTLGPRQRARLLSRLGPLVRVTASDERSQLRNKELASRRLSEKLAKALKIDAPRRATRPTQGATAKRLEAKHRQTLRKLERRPPGGDD